MDEKLYKLVQDKLRPFLQAFDQNNRGGRISPELIAGLGGFLENFMLNFAKELLEREKINKTEEVK